MMQRSAIFVMPLWCAGLGAAGQFSKMSLVFAELELYYGAGQPSPLLGFLVSIISFFGIVLGVTAGLIVARSGFRRMLVGGLLLGAAASVLEATLPPLPIMLGLRLIEGASHLVIVVAAPTLIAKITSARFLPFVMTLWSTFFGVAYALTAWFGTPLMAAFGISAVFYVHAFWMLSIGLLLILLLPRDTPPKTKPTGNILRQHVKIYTNPATAAPALAWLCYTLTFVSLLTVLPPFIDAQYRTITVGLMPLAGIAASLTLGVALQKWLTPVPVVVIGFLSAGCLIALFSIAPGNPAICVALFACLGLVQGANFAAIPALNQTEEDRAHANGAVAQMGNLGNSFGTPIALGMIAAMGFSGLIVFILLAYVLGIVTYSLLGRQRH